ncbi:Hypothetical predicted protein [Mytilus galloprovincialis]|uniref:Uncharacterized protein n=1 Tax=Mytilus galloprovincialis TaxID=29158 RepID=A0A8B6DBZ8_MYTGA|nr:Hypothetical predicted protein [Mytilus galloprovincialis]
MSLGKNQAGVKTVQSLLAAKKPGGNKDQQEKLPKRDTRTHSDVSEESIDNIDIMSIHSDLKDIKKSLQDTVIQSDLESSVDALKSANYNEQYSRKHNIRIVNYPEKNNEHLHAEFINLVKKDLKINLEPTDLIAIHRIPGKEGAIRPIIAKVRNTDTKIKIMRSKKGLKKDIKFHDDITQKNLGLMSRLNLTGKTRECLVL